MIGIAETRYSPDIGLDLVGNYRGDDYASRGEHDPLCAKALVASDSKGNKVALLTVDICKLFRESVMMMRNYISSKTDIISDNILIHATHTHSGPSSDINAPKAIEYLKRAADAVILADKHLKPSVLAVGRSTEHRVSFNRRLQCTDGTTHMCWEKIPVDYVVGPLGSVDPELITLSVEQQGYPAGTLVNFGCHATTLTGNNWLYSADYPGYISEAMKKINGEEFITLFFNGCCGNVTQVDYRVGFIDTFQECQRIGYMLGVAAVNAMNNQLVVDSEIIAVSKQMVPLKRIPITNDQLEWAKQVMKRVEKEGMPPHQPDGMPDADYAVNWLRMYEEQDVVDEAEVMVIRIGDIAFVGLPGEMFCEFGMEVKAASPCKNTLVFGLTNDAKKYLPTEFSFTQGPKGFTPMVTGYETTPGTTMYEKGSGEKLTSSAIQQLKQLFY